MASCSNIPISYLAQYEFLIHCSLSSPGANDMAFGRGGDADIGTVGELIGNERR